MRKKIKVGFSDFWFGFDPKSDKIFYDLLNQYYDIIYDNNDPDILFFSIYGNSHKKYNCTKVFFSPENFYTHKYNVLDKILTENNLFLIADFSITSFDLNNKRNFRMPCYIRRYGYEIKNKISERKLIKKEKKILFLHSNCVSFRDNFVKKLQRYINVDCPGNCNRNININVQDKLRYLEDYKFVMAFENSSYPNYNTEKLIDGFISNTIPIYWGDTNVHNDFNTNSFINYHNFVNEEEVIENILKVDSESKLYEEMLMANPIVNNSLFDESFFIDFFNEVVYYSK
jgi:hypothetical protein